MNPGKRLYRRMMKALLFGRFDPVETIIASSSFIHGLIILSYLKIIRRSIFQVSYTIEYINAISLMIFGGVWFLSICAFSSVCSPRIAIRKSSALGQFASWTMLSVLLLLSPNFHWLVHVGYVSISLIAAFLYLNLSLGENHG